MREGSKLLLIDKPLGITSMDVIRQLRKKLQVRKIGHAGTLDPLATGLMLIGVGAGTKQLAELIALEKEYVTEVRIGESRSTGDLEGVIIAEKNATKLTAAEVKTALAELIGTHRLPVSAFSAIKKAGVPMYKRARQAAQKGEVITEVPWREMVVREAELLQFWAGERAVAQIRFVVGSGTYVRSLGEELGRRLGFPATLQALRRTAIGSYSVTDAETI
jgi:tRNA pseudouridine55 synthase